jgi:hypothetical protein
LLFGRFISEILANGSSTLKIENSHRLASSPISGFEMEASRLFPVFFRRELFDIFSIRVSNTPLCLFHLHP